jgi:predicted ABC-class ATPase
MKDLVDILRRIDGRGYKAYKDLQGREFSFANFTLFADHIQGDPFASPSRLRVRLDPQVSAFPEDTFSNPSRERALRDFLLRVFFREAAGVSARRGTGKSGLISVDRPGEEILLRSACRVNAEFTELRFFAGLPADGRRVLGQEAEEMLVKVLPRLVEASLLFKNLDPAALYCHIETSEDADELRGKLAPLGLVSFVAEGSVLPRRSGVDDRPLENGLPFVPPPGLTVEVRLPNRGVVRGMGIPRGVTLIVGGGFHGKSTLLRGVERGVYNHVPGDGRELVVTDPTAVKIRAEDGRSVMGVDISPFIGSLPGRAGAGGVETAFFETANASGSTSQAANILEALEAGSALLLLDEDTSATNFMIRDRRMQLLVEKANEPITPFVDRVRSLYTDLGVSTVIVMGGSGDYFDTADTVVAMVGYEPMEATREARAIAEANPTGRSTECGPMAGFKKPPGRVPLKESLDARKGRKEVNLKALGTRSILFGTEEIDLAGVEQIVEGGQARAIGAAMVYARGKYMDVAAPLNEVIEKVMEDVMRGGLDCIALLPFPTDLVGFRAQDLAAAFNRLRALRVRRP